MASEGDVFKVPQFKAPVAPAPAADEKEKTAASKPQAPPPSAAPAAGKGSSSSSATLKYSEPPEWSAEGTGDGGRLPPASADQRYFLEEIKNGTVVATHDLVGKTFFVVGRLPANDIQLEHPSLSRHHAVIQYKGSSGGSADQPVGFYLYDLGSTHGSFHNKHRCFPNKYYRLRVGHCLKFGGSTRMLIVQGPDTDMEAESDLSVTELKAIAAEKAAKKAEEQRRKEEEEQDRRRGGSGVNWGMDDDADAGTDSDGDDNDEDKPPDMSRNPFSVIREGEGKELNLNDPKKTLKTWYEKEGFEAPDFQCSETGFAQFKCTLELPVDDEATGRPLVAEAEVKGGKKKEAVAQCALEACRLLDRAGMLRNQAGGSQESVAKIRAKKLREDDFYASDEDEFLDRTGTLEVKRQKRKKMLNAQDGGGESEEKPETFESLTEKSQQMSLEIASLTQRLDKAQEMAAASAAADKTGPEDDLDAFMETLEGNADGGSKETLAKLKLQLSTLQREKQKVDKLVEMTRPAKMPELKKPDQASANNKGKTSFMVGKMFGKRATAKVASTTASSSSTVKHAQQSPSSSADVTTSKPKAFADEEDEEESEKPRLSSLEQFKKDLEAEKNRPAQEEATPPPQRQKQKLQAEGEMQPPEQMKAPKRKNPQLPANSTAAAIAKKSAKKEQVKQPKSYSDLANEDDKYQTWVPPAGQTGDGRTSLNDKLGY